MWEGANRSRSMEEYKKYYVGEIVEERELKEKCIWVKQDDRRRMVE